MKLPHKTLERNLLNSGYDLVCGVDEVGMGCLAGPVVVCAASFSKDFYKKNDPFLKGLKESKLLSASQRELFATKLHKLSQDKKLSYTVSLSSPKKIDAINIYQASREAMREAIEKVVLKKSVRSKKGLSQTMVLVDGNKKIPNLKFDQRAIIQGDQKIFAIACASIIAKVYRDKLMKRYANRFPHYGFEQHKGYSTKLHQNMLNKMGPCPIHRRSFRLFY